MNELALGLDTFGDITLRADGSRSSDAQTIRDIVDEAVRAAVRDAALPAQHVVRADAVPGRTAEVAVALGIDAGLDRAGLDQVLAWVNRALAASSVISERVDSLELRIGKA